MLDATGADGLMIGRAAQGRPWIFREIAHYLATGERLPPPEVECDGLPLRATLAPGEEAELSYRVRFPRRGRHRFGDLWCRASAPLGLLQFDTRTAQPTEVKVYPAPLASGGGGVRSTGRAPRCPRRRHHCGPS